MPEPVGRDPVGALAVMLLLGPLLVLVIVGLVWSWRWGAVVLAAVWLVALLGAGAAHLRPGR